MASLLGYIIFFAIAFFIINHSLFKRYENIYIQKIIYLHNNINPSNLKSFVLSRNFEASLEFNNYPVPKVREEFLENDDYKLVICRYQKRKKTTKQINFILMILTGTAILLGMLQTLL